MAVSSSSRLAARLLGAGLCLLLWAGRTVGQTIDLAGEYVCTEAHVAGKLVPCTAAPLNLKRTENLNSRGARANTSSVATGWN